MASVDVAFPIVGSRVPRDHGYALYGALCRHVPTLHAANWLAVHPIGGRVIDSDIVLGRNAALQLRLPAERIPEVLCLAGAALEVGGARVTVGVPRVFQLVPAASVDARLVVVNVTRVPRRANADLGRESLDRARLAEAAEKELRRQLSKLGVDGHLELRGHGRMKVAGRSIVGFSVRAMGLDARASIALQEHGLGGKRKMGCGIFRPTRGR